MVEHRKLRWKAMECAGLIGVSSYVLNCRIVDGGVNSYCGWPGCVQTRRTSVYRAAHANTKFVQQCFLLEAQY